MSDQVLIVRPTKNKKKKGIAGNVQGLAMGWHFMTVCPQPKPIKKLKVQDNNKKLNSKSSAGTVAETELQLIDFSSASLTPNPLLYCRFFFAFLEQKIRQGTVAQTQQKACLKNVAQNIFCRKKKLAYNN